MIAPNFWRGRRVFVTGHTGFKGSWLSLWLQQLGAEVTGYALAPGTDPNLFDVARVAEGMESEIGDIRDLAHLTAAMKRAGPEIVLHLAAQPIVRRSYVDPVETYSTNVMGLVNVFEAIRAVGGIKACVNVTSDKCYENREWAYGYREIDAMGGYDPYSSSKGCAELVTSAYRQSFFSSSDPSHFVALASARAGNVIGGGDWAPDRLIPDVLRAFTEDRPAIIRNPSAVRPWQHVLEPLCGYLMLGERLAGEAPERYAEAWNFGPAPEDTRQVRWIVNKMVERWGVGASWEKDREAGPHEAHFLSLDCLKAHRDLDWRAVWNIGVAIDKIIDWHRALRANVDMREFTLKQIEEYVSMNSGD
jgi:CDP-glucose 4,6-dehydratase